MSRSRLALRHLLVPFFILGLASPALAAAPRFQIEGLGLASLLSGSASIADQHDRRDLYAPGIGFSIGAEYALTNHVWVGVRTGLVDQSKDGIDPAIALARWSNLPGYSSFRAARATRIDRKLTTIPTHGIVQWRGQLPGRIGYYDEVGVGVASYTDKIEYLGDSGSLMRLSGYQKNLSLLIGAGLSWNWKNIATLVGGADVEIVPSLNGEVWNSGDNPQLVHLELGVRYPRR